MLSIIIYNLFLTKILCVLFPYILVKYKFDKVDKSYNYWIHCASLGEVKIALRLIKTMVSVYNINPSDILLTTTTITAKNYARNFHNETYLLPIDYYFIIRGFVKKIRPKVLIILETELWLNYIYFVKQLGGKIFLLNGRVSQKTFVFFKTFSWLFKPVIDKIDLFLVREEIDFIRFKNLGISVSKLKITGNMKYDDLEEDMTVIDRQNFGFLKDDFIVTFGSIRKKEEKEIINKVVLKFVNEDNVKFILAPRHLKIIKDIEKLLRKYNIKYIFKSMLENSVSMQDYKCLIVDSYGELKDIYKISDIVFVCGSILPYGGQNIIEPALLGRLVVFGKYIFNFLEPAKVLLSNNAAIMVGFVEEFVDIIKKFYNDKTQLIIYGKRAVECINRLKGVTEKNLEIIFKEIK